VSDVCCAPAEEPKGIGASARDEVLSRSIIAHDVDLFQGLVDDSPTPGKIWWCHDVLSVYHGAPDFSRIERVNSVVYATTWQATLGTALLNVPSHKAMVIPYWVDEIVPDTSKFDDKSTVFLWAGQPHHGLGILHAVLKHFKAVEGRDVRLIVFCNSDGGDHIDLMQTVSNEEWVDFRGRADNDRVRSAMATEAHVVALPYTIAAGQPLQLLEGMCAGCVPIVPCYGGLPESIIMDRGTLYRWDPDPTRHATNLARKIDAILNFKQQSWKGFESLAMSYRQVARMKYDWEVVSGVWQNYVRSSAD
jgi:glycosyltransferase involved in cell wall biosynthesis